MMLNFFKKKKKIKPAVYTTVIDQSCIKYDRHTNLAHTMFSNTNKGPTNRIKYYGSKLSEPRWWEFWKKAAYRKECKRVKQEFVKDFGQPTPAIPAQMEYLGKAMETIDDQKIWFTRVKDKQ